MERERDSGREVGSNEDSTKLDSRGSAWFCNKETTSLVP